MRINVIATLLSMLPMVSRWDDDPRHEGRFRMPEWAMGMLVSASVIVGIFAIAVGIVWLFMIKSDGPYQITKGKTVYITEKYLSGRSDGCLTFNTKDLGKVRVCGDYTIKKIEKDGFDYLSMDGGR